MKKLIILLIAAVILNATEYMSKVEPYTTHTISSEVSGKVNFINKLKEYTKIDKKTIVLTLDTEDEKIQVKTLKNSLALQNELVKIKKDNYKNKVKVKQLSIYNKNQEKLYYLESKQSLENMQRDMEIQQNLIRKKEFYISNKYLNKILVSQGEYVEAGTKLYTLYDFSKSKLEVYVRNVDLLGLREKKIFIDGNLSEFSVEKIAQVRDEMRVSTYKVILSKKNNTDNVNYGKVVKVEFK